MSPCKSSGGIRIVTKRKTTSRGISKILLYKVTAAYTGIFKTATDAKNAHSKLAGNSKAKLTPVKKTSKGYSFGVKFSFVTPSAKVRDQAVRGARERNARVTISTMRV